MNEMDKDCVKRYDDFFKDNIEKNQNAEIRSTVKLLVYDNYTGLVHQAAKLIIELAGNKQHDVVYFGLFVYLYRNGYFSKDNQFLYGKPEYELDCLLGASVVEGKGVCRNIAIFLKDVMNEISSIRENKSKALCLGVNSEHHSAQIYNSDMPQNFQLKISDPQGRNKCFKITRKCI
jgi:hypothetical protein